MGNRPNFSTIIGLIQREFDELEQTVTICIKRKQRWSEFIKMQAEDIIADSIAACLHSVYTGLEKMFSIIAREVDNDPPHGQRWHKELLELMNADIPGVRSAVISKKTYAFIEELMLFRHVFRNLYTHNIVPKRIIDLCERLETLWPDIKFEIVTFISFLLKEIENE